MESGFHSEQQHLDKDKLLTLGDILAFAQRRKKIVFAFVSALLFIGILYCIFATRRYQSEALVEVRRPEDALGLNRLVQGGGAEDAQPVNPLEETVTLATTVQELESASLDLQVIDRLHLQDTKDFKPTFDPIGALLGLFSASSKKDAPGTSFLDSPSRRAHALSKFDRHLKVEVVAGTRLISIKYANPDPELAAQVVNELASDLAQYDYKIKSNTTRQLSGWLGEQLDTVRKNAEDLQQREAQLRRRTESYSIGTNGSGQPAIYNPVIDQLQQTTTALNQAQSNRILRSAVEQIVKTRDPRLISGLAGSGMLGSGNPQSTTSLDLINSLETQIAQQKATVSRDQVLLGDSFPRLIQEKAELHALRSSLQGEIDRLANRAKNDAIIAASQERRTRIEHDKLLHRANILNDKYLQYEIVQQEAQDARQLYTDLNQRLRQVGVTVGVQSADTTLFAPGLAADKPHYPRISIVLLASILGGAFLGILYALFLDLRDDKVFSVRTLEAELDPPVFGLVPDYAPTRARASFGKSLLGQAGESASTETSEIEVLARPSSPYSEAMRSLRTSVLLSRPGAAPRVLLVTSSVPAEGKSVTALNLAVTYARNGGRTLLVDANLRAPALAERLGIPASPNGLSLMLTGQLSPEWTTVVPGTLNLSLVPAGQRSPHPHELVGSETMRSLVAAWRQTYEVIIIEGPPILSVSDSLQLAEQADLILLVARYGATSLHSLRRACHLLPRHLRAHAGVLLNAVLPGSNAYYEYYGDQGRNYAYQGMASQGGTVRG
jgi:capsular exopolysaccharide synthesis family protein